MYDDACGTAHGLELLGERWTMLVLRELLLGPRRFSGLKNSLPGISANVLTQRLSELEQRGLVRRTRLPPPASVQVYEATEWGLEADAVIAALGRWAARSPRHDPTLPLSPVSIMLSFRTMLDRQRAAEMSATINFRLNEARFVARVERGELTIERGEAGAVDATITATPEQLAATVYGGALRSTITVEGNRESAERFLSLFALPPKVEAPDARA